MKIITKFDAGKTIEVQLHELFAVEVDTTHTQNEFLAVPAFIQEQNFEIIKEYAYAAPQNSNIQTLGKKIFLLMATKVSEVDLSWYNLSTAREVIHFHLKVSLSGGSHLNLNIANHSSDSDDLGMPDAICRS